MNTENLQQVIKTMSKSEKRYFKLYASRASQAADDRTIRLFDHIDKQEGFREDHLLRKESGFSAEIDFYTQAGQLQEILLKSLHSFHEEKTPEPKIRAQLHYTELLLAKGLEKHARQQLKVARDLARKHELLEYFPAILELELVMADKDNREQQFKKAQLFYEEYCDVLARLEVQAMYGRRLKQVSLMATRTAYSRSKTQDFADLDAFLALPEIRHEQGPSTVRSQFFFNDLHVVASYIKADYNAMHFYSSRLIRLAQEHPNVLQYETEKYISILNRHASACAMLRMPHELLETANMLRAVNTTDERLKSRIFQYAINAEFNDCVLRKDEEAIRQTLDRFEQDFPLYVKRLDPEFAVTLLVQASGFAFSMGEYKRALQWVDMAMRMPALARREDLATFVRITELQCYFELGNEEQLSAKLASFYRFLKNKKSLYEVERALMEHIRILARSTSPNKQTEFFSGLRDSIAHAIRNSPEDKRFFSNNFDLLAWFDSKVKGRPLMEIVMESVGEKPSKPSRKPASGKKKR